MNEEKNKAVIKNGLNVNWSSDLMIKVSKFSPNKSPKEMKMN